METKSRTKITIESTVKAPVEKVWKLWNGPEHITKWANASDDWHTPFAENDLREGGKFLSRMEAKDGSFETFEAEDTNPIEMQRGGWQAILNNFKKYAESN